MSEEKHVILSKQTLPQLQELLDRQKALLRNKQLLNYLKDKGESIRKFYNKIETEIEHRKDVESIQISLSGLNLGSNEKDTVFLKEKHVQYVCSKDKSIEDTRYRPHRTLVQKEIKSSPQKSLKQPTEVTAAFEPKLKHEPIKCIPLSESLLIENEQALRLMEERAKRSLNIEDSTDDENSDDKEDDDDNDLENRAAES